MKVIRGSGRWKEKKISIAVALGNFDGVHLGHQAILKDLISMARKKRWKTAVYTFDPHPAKILAPKTAPLLIQTLEQRLKAIEKTGMDYAIVETFDPAFSNLSPAQFFSEILIRRLQVKGIWAGYDFTFGHKRSGNVETLKKFCQENQILFKAVEAQFEGNTLVSSTQIRTLIQMGHAELAGRLLGRPFALTGEVIRGHGIGKRLGIHTANVTVENELLPKVGIYVTKTRKVTGSFGVGGPKSAWHLSRNEWPSVTSVGFNPTFPGKGFSVETHLIGFDGNLRGKKIEVAFLKRLRDELTFPNEETLVTQIKKDIEEARNFHATFRDHR